MAAGLGAVAAGLAAAAAGFLGSIAGPGAMAAILAAAAAAGFLGSMAAGLAGMGAGAAARQTSPALDGCMPLGCTMPWHTLSRHTSVTTQSLANCLYTGSLYHEQRRLSRADAPGDQHARDSPACSRWRPVIMAAGPGAAAAGLAAAAAGFLGSIAGPGAIAAILAAAAAAGFLGSMAAGLAGMGAGAAARHDTMSTPKAMSSAFGVRTCVGQCHRACPLPLLSLYDDFI